MNKEEKKAIESIKFIQYNCRNNKTIIPIGSVNGLANAIETVLNLIEKQQNKIANQEKEIKLMKSVNINDNYVSKDKIRDKIKFIKSLKEKFYYEENVISILEELLKEE